MAIKAQLLEAHVELTASIRAAETWEHSYTESPATFKRLVREEARLQAAANDYLLGLRDRAERLVNWHEVELRPLEADVIPPKDSDLFRVEIALLSSVLSDHVIELVTIGAQAGEDIYKRPLGFTSLTEAVLSVADKRIADMVSQISTGTRNQIRRAIKRSIKNGESRGQALERIQKMIASPVRAEMIAQTESVNAYQAGLDVFGEESGVKSWTWDSLSGACELCAPLHGVTKKVGQLFTLGNGVKVARPAAHTRCRCGRIANYDK